MCVLLYIAAEQMSVTVTLTNNNKQQNIHYIIQKYIQKFVKREKNKLAGLSLQLKQLNSN